MSARRTEPASVERSEIVAWRRDTLAAAGFAPGAAAELARSRDIDLHALLDLIDQGCPTELAARILAPIDPPFAERWSP